MVNKRDYFAIKIMQKLMDRCHDAGYLDRDAVVAAYRLADFMIEYSALE